MKFGHFRRNFGQYTWVLLEKELIARDKANAFKNSLTAAACTSMYSYCLKMILSEHKVRPDYARRRDRQSFHLTRLARSQEQKAFIDKWIGSMSKALYEAQLAEDAAAKAQRTKYLKNAALKARQLQLDPQLQATLVCPLGLAENCPRCSQQVLAGLAARPAQAGNAKPRARAGRTGVGTPLPQTMTRCGHVVFRCTCGKAGGCGECQDECANHLGLHDEDMHRYNDNRTDNHRKK